MPARLVAKGHEVTLLTTAPPGLPAEETADGVRIVRRGGAVTTRWHAFRWCRSEHRSGRRFDVVVEEINTLPYFAGLYADAATVLWMHQLAREVWWYEAPRAVAPIGYLLEGLSLRLNRSRPALVLSESTRRDLLDLGFPPERVAVIPAAIERERAEPGATEQGLLVYVGRITPSKRVGDLVRMLALVRSRGVDARLAVVGRGQARECDAVLRAARSLGVGRHVVLTGYLPRERKRELLARAALLVMASAREGWGLAVTEANALGVPAVVYDRPGLRDSTAHERSGLVCTPTPSAMADAVVRALDPALRERLAAGAVEWSRQFTWPRAERGVRACAADGCEQPRRRGCGDGLSATPSVSVVVPTLNSAKHLTECLASLRAQDYAGEVEILVVDGGSTDDTLAIARAHGVDRILANPLQTGEAGKAVGLRAAGGALLLSVDSDNVLVGRDWLKRMVAPFEDPDVVSAQAMRWEYRRSDHYITRWAALSGVNDPVSLYAGNV